MAVFPIILIGDTLGQRHRYLNTLVNNTFRNDVNFEEIQTIQDISPVDRLFKIDLASKLKNIDYIIETLKDKDMLHVSRALKCKWLLQNEYQSIINPEYLEQHLYPYMITTAINKMKHWLSINLKDPDRCQHFHKYYSENEFELAIKFLVKCEVTYILNVMPKILEKLDPFYFKLFCERSPQVAKIFFDSFSTNENIVKEYLSKQRKYYDSLKVVLKGDGNIFLDIIENYFNKNIFNRLSPVATKYILNNFKDRFMKKVELYVAWILDIKAIAESLTVDECKDIIIKLARAEYLRLWFNYQNIEPLIKQLPPQERAGFKNGVFVEKNFGDKIKEWQYKTPSSPLKEDDCRFFDDIIHSNSLRTCCLMAKRPAACTSTNKTHIRRMTPLDHLFDEFRFCSFEKTLYELRKRIVLESSPQSREYMMLVLVSKTGGRFESVGSLLKFLTRYRNEPTHLRATIVRSLVKRAFVWRLPEELWQSLLKYAVGLGLDGKAQEAECREALHAVMLRSLLGSGHVEESILSAFIQQVSTLKQYSLTEAERKVVTQRLPAILLERAISEDNTYKKTTILHLLLNVLDEYKLPIDACPITPVLATLVNKNCNAAKNLILRLFKSRKGRREFLEQTFVYISTDASYLNALRHNTKLLKNKEYINRVVITSTRRKQFYRKLAIYFTEADGLADLYMSAIKADLYKILSESSTSAYRYNIYIMKNNARSLAFLAGSNLESILKQFEGNNNKAVKRISALLKANAHLAKPKMNDKTSNYYALGLKAVANTVIVCPKVDIESHLTTLIKRPRTLRMALILSERLKREVEIFAVLAKIRPNVALKCGLKYLYRNPNTFNHDVWQIIKPIMMKVDHNLKTTQHITKRLRDFRKIPESVKLEYCTILYTLIEKSKTFSIVQEKSILLQIESFLPHMNEEFLENILDQFASESSYIEAFMDTTQKAADMCLYLRIFIKFLLLSKSEETQDKRWQRHAEPILKLIQNMDRNHTFNTYLKVIIQTLRYNAAFLNQQYVSCLPVFEKIVSWMHLLCPIDRCFKYFIEIQLTTLYFKSIRQCLKNNPYAFDSKNKFNEIEILGQSFGAYIAKEVNELKSTYFESILELYRQVLFDYLREYFVVNSVKQIFIINMIKGICDYGESSTVLLGVYLLKGFYFKNKDALKEIKLKLNQKDVEEIQFFIEEDIQ